MAMKLMRILSTSLTSLLQLLTTHPMRVLRTPKGRMVTIGTILKLTSPFPLLPLLTISEASFLML